MNSGWCRSGCTMHMHESNLNANIFQINLFPFIIWMNWCLRVIIDYHLRYTSDLNYFAKWKVKEMCVVHMDNLSHIWKFQILKPIKKSFFYTKTRVQTVQCWYEYEYYSFQHTATVRNSNWTMLISFKCMDLVGSQRIFSMRYMKVTNIQSIVHDNVVFYKYKCRKMICYHIICIISDNNSNPARSLKISCS